MRHHRATAPLLLALALLVGLTTANRVLADAASDAQQILKQADVAGGLVVHLGSGDGRLTAALRAHDGLLVQGLDTDRNKVAAARKYIRGLRKYGPVSVDYYDGTALPYSDNLVNLIVVSNSGNVKTAEMMRVLAPRGVIMWHDDEKWNKKVKPVPDTIDEWSHYLHDATGNAVANDDEVGLPQHLQWIGGPRWSRHHDRMASMSALVTSGGRMFYIMDEGSRVSIQLPPKWMLVARDAFSGVILWKRPIGKWHSHLWPLKSGPTQLARRLIATPDRVYVTLDINGPLVALDAATGKTLATYADTKATEEVIRVEGTLLALVSDEPWEQDKYTPKFGRTGDQAAVRQVFWNKKPRHIVAIDEKTGNVKWKKKSLVSPLTLTSDGGKVTFFDTQHVRSLDINDGYEVWKSEPVGTRSRYTFNFGPKLVTYKGVVLFAGGDRKMHAFDATSGKKLWGTEHERGGYESPEDLLVSGGLIWSAPLTSGRDSGQFVGRDPKTGEIKQRFDNEVDTYWFHHRCYIAKATDKFLMPSRTGVEFVDTGKQKWEINHWVRGGCLYGVMPANGLTYAPPHNCACYPEAKLYGFNALAATNLSRQSWKLLAPDQRLEKGPAFGWTDEQRHGPATKPGDWPTYRGDNERRGRSNTTIPANVKPAWSTQLDGKLSALTVADGRVYVAQVDAHTVHALDAKTGKPVWSFTAGGRVDSPPTIHSNGTALFGSVDGYVYCVRADTGELIWRFRAAPTDRRLTSFNQVESVWPVHGNILIEGGAAYFVAGRSMFLDGGIWFYKLDPATGRVLQQRNYDDLDPQTKKSLQDRIATLQMPVGLPDVLSSDGKRIYMRSQVFDKEGVRQFLGPHSGNAAEHGSVQRGETAHIFSPTGFLDDTWFHRSYWIYGRSFAGGHNGYYQAGKYTPAGRLLVADDDNIYGFGRKAQYYRWTTTLEHQLFAAPKAQPDIPKPTVNRRGQPVAQGPNVDIPNKPTLDPTGKPITVSAWVKADKPNGVIVARGGPANGYALVLIKGKVTFMVRSAEQLFSVDAPARIGGKWAHVAGVLTADKQLKVYIDGQLASTTKKAAHVASEPLQATQIGADEGGAVGDFQSPFTLTGLIDEVRIYHAALTDKQIAEAAGGQEPAANDALVLSLSFDKGAADASKYKHAGKVTGVKVVEGRFGKALQFAPRGNARRPGRQQPGSIVQHTWAQDVPLMVQAMAMAGDTIFIMGAPDFIDEEETFSRLAANDDAVLKKLEEQDRALNGEKGALLWAVSAKDGKPLSKTTLDALPVFDGMAAAQGRLYVATRDGKVVCLTGE